MIRKSILYSHILREIQKWGIFKDDASNFNQVKTGGEAGPCFYKSDAAGLKSEDAGDENPPLLKHEQYILKKTSLNRAKCTRACLLPDFYYQWTFFEIS